MAPFFTVGNWTRSSVRLLYAALPLVLGWFEPGRGYAAGPPPVITVQPLDATVAKGDTATFTVVAMSSTTLSYQWYFSKTALAGGTRSSFSRTNVTYAQAGVYWVAVRNSAGTVNSRQATLTVTNTPPLTSDDAYKTLEDNSLTIGSPGVLANDTDANGDILTASLVSTVSHGALTLKTNGAFVYTPASNYFGIDSFTYQASDGRALGNVATVLLNITPVNDAPVAANLNVVLTNYAPVTLVLSATDVDNSVLKYSILTQPTNGVLSGLDSMSGTVTYTPAATSGGGDSFQFTVSDGSLSATGRVSLAIAAPPAIVVEPEDQGATVGLDVSFFVSANGTAPLGYQWTFNGASLDGATDSVLTLTNVQSSNVGFYAVVVTNSLGSVTSAPASFTLYFPPTITTPPSSQTVREGLEAAFSVSVTGSPAVSYQWQFNGADLPGATSSVLALNNVQTNQAGAYTVVVRNVAGSVTSPVATLTVIDSSFHLLQHWAANYKASANDAAYLQAAAVDAQGNVFVTGYARESATAGYDYVTLKYDSSGILLWRAVYDGAAQDDEARALAVDSAGNVYVTGSSMGIGSAWDYATVKYDGNGNQVWVARYDGTANNDDLAAALAVDASGNVFVTGASKGTEDRFNYVTLKYDSAGNQLWSARYVGPGDSEDDACALALDAAGNVYVTGRSIGIGSDFDYATIKYDGDGAQLWVARYNGSGNGADIPSKVLTDAAGNVYVTGRSMTAAGNNDYTTLKYDNNGGRLWLATYDGPAAKNDCALGMAVDSAGNVFVTGTSAASDTKSGYATLKYSPDGAQLWAQRFEGADDSQAAALALDPSGDVYVTGKSKTTSTGYDFATVKYRSLDGTQLTVARYNSSGSLNDSAVEVVVDAQYNIYVAGQGFNPLNYVIVQYQPSYLAPAVSTLAPSDVTVESAVLNATVNPQGAATTWLFQYGPAANYGLLSPAMTLPPLTNAVSVALSITGLASGTLYHCSVVASNAAGLSRGQDVTFATGSLQALLLSIAAYEANLRLSVESAPGVSFTLLNSTNLSAAATEWTVLGPMSETAPGQYEFTIPEPTTTPLGFFRLQSP